MSDKYFKQHRSTTQENKARFFIIELPFGDLELRNALDLALIISKKFSSRSSFRAPDSDRFCPYIHFANTNEQIYKDLKVSLRAANVLFLDGHDFKGADFHVDSILKGSTSNFDTRLKLIDELGDLNSALHARHFRPLEVYEFYSGSPAAGLDIPPAAFYAAIKVDSLDDIKEILK